ncbi:MAG: hypothetical protein H6811_06330 [Phycisphaeraceae bacterium]|nr:hypothetical protein [Phycisphaeraceae bacterium]
MAQGNSIGSGRSGDSEGVDALAARIRAIQADLADSDGPLRAEHIAEEIDRAVGRLLPDQRLGFLEALGARFPSWDSDLTASAASESKTRSVEDRQELNDPSLLVRRLTELTKGWSEQKRAPIVEALKRAGLAPSGEGGWPADAAARFCKAVYDADQGPIDGGRALDLSARLVLLVLSLEKVVWRTWQQMSPRSIVKRRYSLQKLASTFVSGDQAASRGDLESALEELRQMTAGIIAAVAQAGHLSWVRLGHLLPDEVMAAAKEEGKKAWESWEVAYWRRYKDLASTIDPATFESEILRGLADWVEEVIGRGARTVPGSR